jgi:2-keto-3-deoxy-L-rhamnonate aldolase RhmA
MTARGGDFKASLRAGETHFGLFLCLPTFPTAEALAQSDFGFYIIDVEHGPTSVPNVHVQLTALAGSSAATIARLSANDPVAIKYYLDIGTDALMIPNVESAAMARDAARYMRYAPDGVRGVGGSMRVTDYGRNMAYFKTANEQACFVAQIESVAGMRHLEEICGVPEIDVIFFGPNDYAAQIGLLGQPAHPDVVAAMDAGIDIARGLGKACGILVGEPLVDHFLEKGVQVIAVGSEIGLMARAADALAQRCNAKRTVRV